MFSITASTSAAIAAWISPTQVRNNIIIRSIRYKLYSIEMDPDSLFGITRYSMPGMALVLPSVLARLSYLDVNSGGLNYWLA